MKYKPVKDINAWYVDFSNPKNFTMIKRVLLMTAHEFLSLKKSNSDNQNNYFNRFDNKNNDFRDFVNQNDFNVPMTIKISHGQKFTFPHPKYPTDLTFLYENRFDLRGERIATKDICVLTTTNVQVQPIPPVKYHLVDGIRMSLLYYYIIVLKKPTTTIKTSITTK